MSRKTALRGLIGLLCACLATSAHGLSITPMTKIATTLIERQGVMVTVANTIGTRDALVVEAFEPDLRTPARGVRIAPASFRLGPNARRRVRVIFDLNGQEREIAVCVRPDDTVSLVVPRVCGRYLGRRRGAR